MIPTFRFWVENSLGVSAPSEEESSSGVSEPQHEKGEESLSLNKFIEKRILEIVEDLERKGKATKDQVISSLRYFLNQNQSQASQSAPKPQNSEPQQPQAGPQTQQMQAQ